MGAVLRMPLDAVRQRMLDDLHGAGFTDPAPAHSAVLRCPGPHGRRPLAAEVGMTMQAMTLCSANSSSWATWCGATILWTSRHGGSNSRSGAPQFCATCGKVSWESRLSSRANWARRIGAAPSDACRSRQFYVRQAYREQTSQPSVVLDEPTCARIARRSAGEQRVDVDGDGRRGVGH